MNKKPIPVLLAVGCAVTLLLLAAGCGTPAALDQGQAVPSAAPTLTSLPSPTEAEQAKAATHTPLAITPSRPSAEGTPRPTLRIAPTVPARIAGEVTMPISPTIPIPSSPGLQKLVLQAMEDLAQRLGVTADQIDLVELKAVVWPDGALGCPEPGMAYTQVQQEGLLIRFRAGKRIYPYHSGGGTPPFLCKQAISDDTQ